MSIEVQTIVFKSLRIRFLITIFLFSVIMPIALLFLIAPNFADALDNPIYDNLTYIVTNLLIALFCFLGLKGKNLSQHFSFGEFPAVGGMFVYALFAIPMIAISFTTLYLVFVPLSQVWPEFVKEWILDEPNLLIWKKGTSATIANFLALFYIVIFAPVLEEVFFRGFLLNRLREKYRVFLAIVISSFLFAILHSEILGTFIFGAVLSVIYLRTNSLIGPIIIHIVNNAIAVGYEAVVVYKYGPDEKWTIAQFQSEWYYAVIASFIAIPWLLWFWKNPDNLPSCNQS